MPSEHPSPDPARGAGGLLAAIVRRVAGASARRPRTAIALWLVLVVGCVAGGALTGTKTLTAAESGVGESARADARLAHAGLKDPAVESILIRSSSARTTAAAARDVAARVKALPQVAAVHGPRDTPALSRSGGRVVLVQASLRGDPDTAADRVAPVQRAVTAARAAHPGATVQQAGLASLDRASTHLVESDLRKAEVISLPITLLILVLAFGALVAASVPLLLGITSVAAAMGALGVVSQIAPIGDATASTVVLIGLAVGVDYSLFYVRREREERRAGRGPAAAIEVAAATVGRAILVSGLTVMVALAGLLVTGLADFRSLALGTILVVAIAVVGSLTVLPAVLAGLGDKVDRGRVPLLGRRGPARNGISARLARLVTRRPLAALVTAACVLGALAVPAVDLHTAIAGDDLPADEPVLVAKKAIERTFPGAPADAVLVVTGHRLDARDARARLHDLGARAARVTGGRGTVTVDVARGGRTAAVLVPLPDRGVDAGRATIRALRDRVSPTAAQVAPGARAMVTGAAAADADFSQRLNERTPLVIAFVLGLAFVLLVATFRSPALAAAVMALNLLSIGAAYGVEVAIFQHTWAEGLLGFTSSGAIVPWMPLMAFVILFGLSMDYTVLVLERIREARRAGFSPREAAAEGVAATSGTVTSAAVVMVAVFAIFATLHMLALKQLGVGLATAVLLDATIVRGVALPAVVALLGERGVKAGARARGHRDGWDTARRVPQTAPSTDAR